MKRYIALSAIALLSSVNIQAAEDLNSMFKNGKASGQIREFSINRAVEYSSSAKTDYTRSANAIGGHLKFVTDDYKGLSLATAFYTTNGFANPTVTDTVKIDPTLGGPNNDSSSILGEVFIKLKMDETVFIGGRQKINNPGIGADDFRMLPNFVETYSLTNKNLPDTTLAIAHTTKFAQSPFGGAYDTAKDAANAQLGASGGYSAVDSKGQIGEFVNMGTYAVGKATSGITSVSATYTGVKGLKVQVWDFYAHDIMNTIYAEATYKKKIGSVTPFVGVQFIKQNDVGGSYLKNTAISTNGELDSMFYGIKAGVSVENFTLLGAYTATTENSDSDLANEGSATKSILTMWGAYPSYTGGMTSRHSTLAGTKASKIAAIYNFKAIGPDLKAVLYYLSFDMHKNNGYTSDNSTEAGFDFIYNTGFVENLQLRFRGNFARDFNVDSAGENVGWDEYRFIANYNF
jgi:imipenem/basic amino acid-specific outer membrane pore